MHALVYFGTLGEWVDVAYTPLYEEIYSNILWLPVGNSIHDLANEYQ